ncbi:MAG: hypothetical protein IH621_13430 [Krumholzibacteria bacterium]|nr:hypothetical protein [Candidatus Krumholzibacteria bacterium]
MVDAGRPRLNSLGAGVSPWITRLALAGTAVFALYLAGVGRWLLLAYIVYTVLEAGRQVFRRPGTPDPVILFTIGWVAPFALTWIPVERFIFKVEPLSRQADLTWLGCLLVFLYFSAVAGAVLDSVSGRGRASPIPTSPPIPWSFTVLTMAVSNFGFAVAAAANGLRLPVFQADVTVAAADFFSIRGTSSLFDLGKVGVLLCAWWIVWLVRRGSGGRKTLVTIVLIAIYIVEQVLIGKRMGLLLSSGALIIVLATLRVLRVRHLAVAVLLAAFFVAANAYIRAKPYFESGFRDENVSALGDLWQLAILQPVVYVTETFGSLETVAQGRLDPTRVDWRDYVFRNPDDAALEAPDDAFLELRGRGKMVPFVGTAIAAGGPLAGVLITILFAAAVWGAYAWSSRSLGVIIYADLGAKYLVVWTGNYLVNGGTYYNLAYAFALLLLAAIARAGWRDRAVAGGPAEDR